MLTELTKQYSILFNSQGGVIEFGLATAGLYMAMSLPLSWFSRWVERRMDAEPGKGVVG
jgi:polar amino acid transport system substrate-binding protein